MLNLNLSDRIAVVTGGASGIGRATAESLHECGARVVVLDRAPFDQRGAEIGYCRADVADPSSIDGAMESIEAKFGAIEILVNAAGIMERPLPIERASDKEWDRVLSVNLRGTYLCCRHVGLRMAELGRGSIVNVASVAGFRASPLRAYGPSKAAVINLTKGLASEWALAGVRVNAVAPGFTNTAPIGIAAGAGLISIQKLADANAMRRLVTAQEVANAIVFLASDQASAITGVTLPVDCGYLVANAWGPYRAPDA